MHHKRWVCGLVAHRTRRDRCESNSNCVPCNPKGLIQAAADRPSARGGRDCHFRRCVHLYRQEGDGCKALPQEFRLRLGAPRLLLSYAYTLPQFSQLALGLLGRIFPACSLLRGIQSLSVSDGDLLVKLIDQVMVFVQLFAGSIP